MGPEAGRVAVGSVSANGYSRPIISSSRVPCDSGSVSSPDVEGSLAREIPLSVKTPTSQVVLEQTVRTLLVQLGFDHTSMHLRDTPRRVVQALRSFCQPVDLVELLTTFDSEDESDAGAMVVQVDIPFSSLCPHHLMPFTGTCDIAYVPDKVVVGLSKLARVAQAAALCEPSTQEHITNVIADTFQTGLAPVGVMVITSALHTCMSTRGANVPTARTRVSAIRGLFKFSDAARAEALSLMRTR